MRVLELAQQFLWIDPELLQQAGMLLVVDLVGQLLFGLLDFVLLPPLAKKLDDFLLID
jgi:hypothetical protein